MEQDNSPRFVHRQSGPMTADCEYASWLATVKENFRNSQIKAAVRVNTSMLEFYWQLGKDLTRLRGEAKYGSALYKNL